MDSRNCLKCAHIVCHLDSARCLTRAGCQILSECLSPIPVVSPTYVLLPVEPLEVLSQKWGLSRLDLYEERWKVEDTEVLSHIRRLLPAGHRARPNISDRFWRRDDDGRKNCLYFPFRGDLTSRPVDYDDVVLRRPLSPVLTHQSSLATPKPGAQLAKQPQSTKEFLHWHKLGPVTVSDPKDPNIQVDDALYVQAQMQIPIPYRTSNAGEIDCPLTRLVTRKSSTSSNPYRMQGPAHRMHPYRKRLTCFYEQILPLRP